MSKWSAVAPLNQEKHFLVTRLIEDDASDLSIVLEAVHSKNEYVLPWADLKDDSKWYRGWR